MINLSTRELTVPQDNAAAPSPPPQPGDASPAAPAAASSGKPAPKAINGTQLPAGATVVEDPKLIEEILRASGKK